MQAGDGRDRPVDTAATAARSRTSAATVQGTGDSRGRAGVVLTRHLKVRKRLRLRRRRGSEARSVA
jgi:hypothetical protein